MKVSSVKSAPASNEQQTNGNKKKVIKTMIMKERQEIHLRKTSEIVFFKMLKNDHLAVFFFLSKEERRHLSVMPYLSTN